MANEPAKTWVAIVIAAGMVVCLCIILGLLWYMWYAWDGGILREEARTVEEPGTVEGPGAVEEPATVEEPERYGPPGVTLANFARIRTGMSYREVVAIFGCEGTLKSISKTSPGRGDMRFYEWRDRERGWAYICFVDGRVFGADQHYLQ